MLKVMKSTTSKLNHVKPSQFLNHSHTKTCFDYSEVSLRKMCIVVCQIIEAEQEVWEEVMFHSWGG